MNNRKQQQQQRVCAPLSLSPLCRFPLSLLPPCRFRLSLLPPCRFRRSPLFCLLLFLADSGTDRHVRTAETQGNELHKPSPKGNVLLRTASKKTRQLPPTRHVRSPNRRQ